MGEFMRAARAILATHDFDVYRSGDRYTVRVWEEGEQIVEVTRWSLLDAMVDAREYLVNIRKED